jgi:Protein of unknown function (DUF2589)
VAIRPTDPQALLLYQIIGAPLLAVIQAEAQAAQVSADFISHIGFEPRPAPPATADVQTDGTQPVDDTQPTATTQPDGASTVPTPSPKPRAKMLQDGGDIGALRVAEFRVDRIGRDGNPIPYTARVPVLSLYPIPLMQVKHAEFDFDIRVVTRVPLEDPQEDQQEQKTAQQEQQPPQDTDQNNPQERKVSASSKPPNYLDASRVELKGFLANTRGGAGGRTVTDASIKVRVRMEQSDLPAGLIQLLKMMDDNVSLVPATEGERK